MKPHPIRWELRCLIGLVVLLPLASYPIAWWLPSWASYRFQVIIPWGIIFSVAFLLIFSRSLLINSTFASPPGVWILLALHLGGLLISTRWSTQPHFSILALPSAATGLCAAVAATRFPRLLLHKIVTPWTVVAAVIAINGFFHLGRDSEFVSTIGNRNLLSAYLAASFCLAVSLNRRWFFLIGLIILIAMVYCRSRGGWVALGGGGLTMTLVLLQRHRRLLAWITAACVAAGGFFLLPKLWATEIRPLIWESTTHMISDRPIIGHGIGTFAIEFSRFRMPEYFRHPKSANLTDHAHNELLEVTAEQGWLGGLTLLALWISTLYYGARLALASQGPSRQRLLTGLLGATVALMLHGLLDMGLRYPPNQTLLWITIGLLWGSGGHRHRLEPLSSALLSKGLAVACLIIALTLAVSAVAYPLVADVWDRRARLADDRGDYQSAIACADQALQLQPLRIATRYRLAGVLAQRTATRQRAVQEALKIEELAPDYADITFNLGQLYLADHHPEEAVPYLRRAVEINPWSVEKQLLLAFALGAAGQFRSACIPLHAALRLDPNNTNAHSMLAVFTSKIQK